MRRQQRLFEEIEGNWLKLQFNWSPQLNSSGPIIMLNKMRDAGSSIVYLKSEGWGGGGCAQTQPWAPLSAFGQSVALVPARSAVIVIVVLACFIAGAVAGGEKEQ